MLDISTAELDLAGILKISPWILLASVVVFATWETFRPRAPLRNPAAKRWGIHILLSLLSPLFHQLLPGLGSIVLATAARSNPYGLLNHKVIPYSMQFVCTIAGLDLVAYWRHRISHNVSLAWRLHLLHHSDRDLDFTNGFRFHPLEVIFITCLQSLAVLILAPPPVAVAVTVILQNLNALYTHANIVLPGNIERALRLAFVTPTIHRIHHLREGEGQRKNLGDLLSVWDRVFGTFQEEISGSYGESEVGLREITAADSIRFSHIFGAPFGR